MTGDEWVMWYLTKESPEDQNRAPHRTLRKMPKETGAHVLTYRQEHPAINAMKIRKNPENKGYTQLSTPAQQTIFQSATETSVEQPSVPALPSRFEVWLIESEILPQTHHTFPNPMKGRKF